MTATRTTCNASKRAAVRITAGRGCASSPVKRSLFHLLSTSSLGTHIGARRNRAARRACSELRSCETNDARHTSLCALRRVRARLSHAASASTPLRLRRYGGRSLLTFLRLPANPPEAMASRTIRGCQRIDRTCSLTDMLLISPHTPWVGSCRERCASVEPRRRIWLMLITEHTTPQATIGARVASSP